MTTKKFVKAFHIEKQELLNEYMSENSETEVRKLLNTLKLTEEQTEILQKVFDSAITDVFYTILLGLDGASSIGGIQETYDLKDENGNQLSGEIEEYAYEAFKVKTNVSK